MDILVMESSTTSAKAMVYDTIAGSLQVVEKTYYDKKTDDGLQNPEDIFFQTAVLASKICNDRKIGLIVLSGTFHSVMLCDLDMKPKTPSFLWSFTGANELCAGLRSDADFVRLFYETTGCMVHSIYPFFKLKYLKGQGQDIKKCYIMGQGSYNYFRMTGIRAEMDSMASGTGLLNINNLTYDSNLMQELGIHKEQLPRLVKWNETSPLGAEAAHLMGVQAGIPVIATGPDGALNQMGSDALSEGIMTLSVGTSAAMRMSVPKPRLSDDKSTWCYLSPKMWLSGAATSGGCNCVDWIKRLMFPIGTSYEECEKGIGNCTDKAPIFLPFLYGERCPGWNDERRAFFCDVFPQHTSSDYYYSVLEGVLFNIYQCYLKLCDLNGEPQEIRTSGGILNSSRWLHMCADMLGNELTMDTIKHSSMVGGLVLGLELIGQIFDGSAMKADCKKKIVPQLKMHDKYMERFKIYEQHYKRCSEN